MSSADSSQPSNSRLAQWRHLFSWDTPTRGWLGGLSVVTVLVPLWLLGGIWGALAWVVIALSWFVFPPIVPVAIGQFAIVALSSQTGGLSVVVPTEATLLLLLVGDLLNTTRDLSLGLLVAGIALILTVGLGILLQVSGLYAASLCLLICLLHRPLLSGLRQFIMPAEVTE